MDNPSSPFRLRRVPEQIQAPAGQTVYLIPDDQMDDLLPPPTDLPLPCSGFLDREGHFHYEICHHSWYFPRDFWSKVKIGLHMKEFYMSTADRICAGCLCKNPKDLVGAGIATYYPKDRHAELLHLGLKPLSEIPNIDPKIRQKAIFRFQESYNRFIKWLGGERLTTYTAIIPEDKMLALGWQRFKIKSPREYLKTFWYCTPASLFGKLRAYEIILP